MSAAIPLSAIYPIGEPNMYKLHLASWNKIHQPLDVFVRNRADWISWNEWRGSRDDFNRALIYSLIDFYPQPGRWLFGGAYRVIGRRPDSHAHSYDVELLPECLPYIGRLKVHFTRPGRAKSLKLEEYLASLIVSEILAEPYTGEAFAGYDGLNLGFETLESLMNHQRMDWKTALENVKGVYMITDASNGKRYVGSAYGGAGVWSRWSCYIYSGHGFSDELTRLIAAKGVDYARSMFRFTLLEHFPMKIMDDVIIAREGYWKSILLSRNPAYGYNLN